MSTLPVHLEQLIRSARPLLEAMSGPDWDYSSSPDKWTRREILGHLIDSAANNRERLVRALHQPRLDWPSYDQEQQVSVQRYRAAPPELLLDLWTSLNRHMALLMGWTPQDKLNTECRIGAYPPMTLNTLLEDYVAHLEHHLRQILGTASLPYSGMPWPPRSQ